MNEVTNLPRVSRGSGARLLALAAMALIAMLARSPVLAGQAISPHDRDVAVRESTTQPEWYLFEEGSDACRLFVREMGTGPDTVIVVHGGFGAEYSYMLAVFEGQWRKHHFVFYDQRGSLRSACPDSLVTFSKHVDDLERLRAALHLRRATIVAHSMGTLIAMDYLQRHPATTGTLVLLGAHVPWAPRNHADSAEENRSDSLFQAWANRPEKQQLIHALALDNPVVRHTPKGAMMAFRIGYASANVFHLDRFERVEGGLNLFNQRAGDAAYQTLPPLFDYRPALRADKCPVWIIDGDHDLLDMGAVRHRKWIPTAPAARLVLLPDAGHDAWIDDPAEFRRALDGALRIPQGCR